MTKATIRGLARRRLQEITADNWADSDLDTLIEIAYAFVVKQVRKTDPQFLVYWYNRNVVAGTNWYALPAGMRGLIQIKLSGTKLERKSQEVAEGWTGQDSVYCTRGGYVGIFPTPATSIVAGLEIMIAPTPGLALDTDEPAVEATLQYAIVLWTVLLAKGESPESDSKEATQLNQILSDIPEDYANTNLDQPLTVTVDINTLPGPGGTARPNDVFADR